MLKPKIKVGYCYKFKFSDKCTMAFAVSYGFERGKNEDVYTLEMYKDGKNFDFLHSQIVYAEEQLLNKKEIEEVFRTKIIA